MAKTFPLKLVTPTGVLFEGPVEMVTAVGAAGEFGVLAEHVDFVTSLAPGIMTIEVTPGQRQHHLICGGLAEIKNGAMTILATDVEAPGTQDAANASRDAATAEERLGGMSSYDSAYPDVEHELLLARARQHAAGFQPDAR